MIRTINTVNIALPGLLWQDLGDIRSLYSQLNIPNWNSLISKASVKSYPFNYSDLLYTTMFPDIHGSMAKYFTKLNNLDTNQYYIIAEPTHLRADRDRLLISEAELLQLDKAEALQFIAAINEYFAGLLTCHYITNNLWLIGLGIETGATTTLPIVDIIGENIDGYLPNTVAGIHYSKILNELQMLLFNLPENKQRKSDGLLTLNSLWLWDKQLDSNKLGKLANLTKITNHSEVLLHNPSCQKLTRNIIDCIKPNQLLIVDNLYYPCCYRDSHAWINNLEELDQILVQPLWHQLQNKQIGQINVFIPTQTHTLEISVSRMSQYKFWQKTNFVSLIQGNTNEI